METHPFRGTDASGLSAGFLIVFFLIAGVLIKIGFVWWAAVLMLGLCLLDISCKMNLVPQTTLPKQNEHSVTRVTCVRSVRRHSNANGQQKGTPDLGG
jgi:hypothetical protein